tara:strand:+ start:715 stop:903 length:189 start_codon:yes stop_codon:yes gene_type:complete
MKQKTFKKNIILKTGNTLELECTQEFLDKIQQYFNLDESPSDDHIRMFLHGSVKSAIDKADE